MKTEILNQTQISQKVERIAFEILENFYSESEIFVGGIEGNGYIFAERLVEKIKEISNGSFSNGINLFKITISKDSPLEQDIILDIDSSRLAESSIILVDDVINSGRTLIHAVTKILEQKVRNIKTAVLVNRTHRRFPISADFVGMDITTTLQETIHVQFKDKEIAYLE